MYSIKVHTFEGPLELLLELLQKEELDIHEVSLAAVTEQYLGHLMSVAERRPDDLADFLVVAAKLLLLKSRVLLPTLEWQDDDGGDLEKQLRMYREYFEASKKIEAIIKEGHFTFPRARGAAAIMAGFYPPQNVSAALLRDTFAEILTRLEPVVRLPSARLEQTVSIEEKIDSIRRTILERLRTNFKTLLKGAATRTEVIVSFLALLELVKQRVVAVRQADNFNDIEIEILSHEKPKTRKF